FRILGIAGLQFFRGRDEALPHLVVQRGVNKNPLYPDTTLPGLVEAARDQPRDHEIQSRLLVRIDDAGRVATQFQHHFLLARARLEFPADLAAGERQELQAFVRDEWVGILDAARQDRERALRQIGFRQHFTDDQRADRRAFGRLQHERAARRDRGRDLVRDQVQREVEWRDEGTRPQWHTLDEAAIALGAFGNF